MPGRSIKIYLVDGTSSGVRTAELGLSTIKALVVPRASLSAVTRRWEVTKTGIYVLVGNDANNLGQKEIYVGEGDNIISRLAAHNKDPEKDFWDEAVLFVSKDENLTKAHVRYVEAKLISLANAAKRASVKNGTSPSEQGRLPEADEVEMEEFIAQSRLLLGALSYDFFEPTLSSISAQNPAPAQTGNVPPTFEFKGEHYHATCVVDTNAGQFIVKANSTARRQETPSLSDTYKTLRSQLVSSGVLAAFDANSYKFTQDYAFSAPTPAAQVVSGTTASGRTAWKSAVDNKTLADWQDLQLPKDVISD